MTGFLCMGTAAKTDEEYKNKLKAKRAFYIIMIAAGIVTLAARRYYIGVIADYVSGFYLGFGTSIIASALILLIRNEMIMRDEKKLHGWRVKSCDERNVSIANDAFRTAALILFAATYIYGIIAGIKDQQILKMMSFLVCTFAASYVIAYKVISLRK